MDIPASHPPPQLTDGKRGSASDQKKKKDQLTLLYAALLAKRHGLQLCSCKTLRCKVCLNCLGAHCLCGRSDPSTTSHAEAQSQSPSAHVQTHSDVRPNPSANAPPTPAGESGRAPPINSTNISNLVSYYLKQRQKIPVDTTLKTECPVCGKVASSDCVKCDKCQTFYHIKCLKLNKENLPTGMWYCKECLPETKNLFYPPEVPPVISLIERARVIQIISGEASRLSEESQLAFVERYTRNMKVGSKVRLFIYKHSGSKS